MNEKFTPGPWYIKTREAIRCQWGGESYTRTTILDTPEGQYSRRHVIAQVARGNGREKANAALIAAAPEMYNSNETTLRELENIVSGLDNACGHCDRYLLRGKRVCRNCAAEKARKIAQEMKKRISGLQQKARWEQEE